MKQKQIKLIVFLISGVMILGLVTGCGSSDTKESDVSNELNDLISKCTSENDEEFKCASNDYIQSYLETYSDYRLLNVSNKEFVSKPQESNSLMSYGISTDFICNYEYALIYNEETKQAFSVSVECEKKATPPTFKSSTEIE